MLGFRGLALPSWLRAFEKEHGLGGVILFDRDVQLGGVRNVESPAQVSALCAAVHSLPSRPLVFVDQEGGPVRAFRELPPGRAPRAYTRAAEALAAGRETGRALRRSGVHVDLAPVLDSADGPLGSRHFRSPSLGVAFARGLAAGGAATCAKHFPGLGSASISTDLRPHVEAVVRDREVAAFRSAVRAGVPCVMTSHAFYPSLGSRYRASLQPSTYRLLRSLGFEGVAITDSLSLVR
ncbi:MAG TPA: glycoside hydrolase family 3 N-terminal domain-containing protein, partial [Myxococcota bacterium]|nr:glycoside hydrolase family 3 N-terminal domain-containing protein [Myxococcota bacterium]